MFKRVIWRTDRQVQRLNSYEKWTLDGKKTWEYSMFLKLCQYNLEFHLGFTFYSRICSLLHKICSVSKILEHAWGARKVLCVLLGHLSYPGTCVWTAGMDSSLLQEKDRRSEMIAQSWFGRTRLESELLDSWKPALWQDHTYFPWKNILNFPVLRYLQNGPSIRVTWHRDHPKAVYSGSGPCNICWHQRPWKKQHYLILRANFKLGLL